MPVAPRRRGIRPGAVVDPDPTRNAARRRQILSNSDAVSHSWTPTASTSPDGGEPALRRVPGNVCGDVVSALALITALSIDPAATLTPPPKPPPPKPKPDRKLLGKYGSGLGRSVNSEKRYPRAARKMGMEGTVKVRVVVRPNGSILPPVTIKKSSGYKLLDQEAIRMVTAAAPFGPLPKGFEKPVPFNIPVRFKLD